MKKCENLKNWMEIIIISNLICDELTLNERTWIERYSNWYEWIKKIQCVIYIIKDKR
jgi:hypothetical protein